MRVPALRAAVFAVLASMLAATAATSMAAAEVPVTSGVTTLDTITDGGKSTTFDLYWAKPADTWPRAAVVVFHGHSHNARDWQAELAAIASRDRVLALAAGTEPAATDPGPFEGVDEEARNSARALAWVHRTQPNLKRTYLLCVSMGCTGAAYFLDAATRAAAGDRDATWVQRRRPLPITGLVVSEGLSNLVETWAEAAGADPASRAEIEQETRTAAGPATPAQNPAAYRSRSLALLPNRAFIRSGLSTAAVVHGVNDGLVPFNQPLETRQALTRGRVPFHGYTVVRDNPGCTATNQTTASHYVSPALDPLLCMAGHATETDPETPIMRVTFDVLHQMLTEGVGVGESVRSPDIN